MNTFNIYTYGGGELLAAVLEAIGRMFASDSEYFTPVGKFSLIFGTLWAGVRAISKGNIGIFGKDYLIPSFLILTLLFTPKTTVWIHDEVSLGAPQKIDNIPLAVSAFVGISSELFHFVTVQIETHLTPTDGAQSHKSGLLFGAKAIAKLKDVKIVDPDLLHNTKEFTRQCFQVPFVVGNLLGKRNEAMNSSDILAFLSENTPEWFGLYWKDREGEVEFKTCKSAIPLILAGVKAETEGSALRRFGQKVGFLAPNESTSSSMGDAEPGVDDGSGAAFTARLKSVMGDSLRDLNRGQADLNQWMQQSMILNASREGLDDWRESKGLTRLYPEVISMNATRGIFQQMTQGLISGEMMADLLPRMHAVLLAVLMAMVFIVYPLCLMPGGVAILKFWVIAMVSVTSWPLFFAIIQGIGLLIMRKDGLSMGPTEGMSMLSQGAYAEMIMNNFSISQGLCALVPILAWSLISKSSYGLSQMMSGMTGAVSSVAGSLGSQAADGNLSMGNVSQGNISYGQQKLAPNVSTASSYGTGTETSTLADNGQTVYTQNVDSLKNNYQDNRSKSIQAEAAINGAQSMSRSNQEGWNTSMESRFTTGKNCAETASRNESLMNSLSQSDRNTVNYVASNGLSYQEGYSHQKGQSNTVGASHSASVGANFMGTGASVSTSSGASNTDSMNQDESAQKSQRMEDSLSRLSELAQSDAFQNSSAATKSAAADFSAANSEVRSYSQALSESNQEVQTYSDAKRAIDSGSQSSTDNMNRIMINEVKAQNSGITTDKDAVSWMNSHKGEAQKIFSSQLSNKDSELTQSLAQEGSALRGKALESTRNANPAGWKQSVQNHAQDSRQQVESKSADLKHIPKAISQKSAQFEQAPQPPKPSSENLDHKYAKMQKENKEGEKSTNIRAAEQTAQNVKEVYDAHQTYSKTNLDEHIKKIGK